MMDGLGPGRVVVALMLASLTGSFVRARAGASAGTRAKRFEWGG
jgi:hypothetical protein